MLTAILFLVLVPTAYLLVKLMNYVFGLDNPY